MKHEAIKAAWAARNRLLAEGDKLYIEGYKLRAEGDKLYIEGDKRYAEGKKLREEGNKLRDEGYKVYRDAVTAKHGDKAVFDWETGEMVDGGGRRKL